MSDFWNGMKTQQNQAKTLTENGAVAYATSGKALLDFNFAISALRKASEKQIISMYSTAFYEDPLVAVKFLFWLRDPRGGAGERRIFRVCLGWLQENREEIVEAVLHLVPEFGRWDDLWMLLDTDVKDDVLHLVSKTLECEKVYMVRGESIGLIMKWLPSENSSSKQTKHYAEIIRTGLDMTQRQYRKMLSAGRQYLDVVERKMSSGEWDAIKYEAVPSRANLVYNRAFLRHDEERRRQYLASLQKGETKINAGVLQPHEIVGKYLDQSGWGVKVRQSEDVTLEELWKALPDLSLENTLVVRDGSSSMTGGYGTTVRPLDVATALAIYMGEHNSSEWRDKFITFSSRPKLIDLSNAKSLREKINICFMEDECSNTNIEATMMLILNTAISNHLSQSEMPSTVLICSDMQFDAATNGGGYWSRNTWASPSQTLFEEISDRFKEAGYLMPKMVFWNLSGSVNKTIPIQQNELGVILLSGFSVQLLKMVMGGELDSYKALLETINAPRYDAVEAALKGIL